MKKAILVLILISLFLSAWAQNPQFEWAYSMGGSQTPPYSSSTDIGYAVTTDLDGNIYTTGSFRGVADFDPGSGSTVFDSQGFRHIFIQKTDADGNFLWAVPIGSNDTQGYSDFSAAGYDIATDALGNIYVVGYFILSADFDPGPGTANMSTTGSGNAFVLKLDANGNYIWSKSIGNYHVDNGQGITVDVFGNVYVTGNFRTTVDFDPGPGTANLTADYPGQFQSLDDPFVLKLDTDGNYQWAVSVGADGYDFGFNIVTDTDGNVYASGAHTFDIDFDPGQGTFYTGRGEGCFVQKLDTNGNFVWAASFGDRRNGYAGSDVAVDDSNNVYLTGVFQGTQDFGSTTLTSNAYANAFMVKLNENGEVLWANAVSSAGITETWAIAVDGQSNIYSAGTFGGTVDFDPGTGTFPLTPSVGQNTFIQKLDTDGNFVWAGTMGGEAKAIHVTPSCDVLVTGNYSETTDFDPGSGSFNLAENGTTEIYVVKLSGGCSTTSDCPVGDITLTTQEEVDGFATDYPGCTELLGNLTINSSTVNSISNLNGLSGITSIEGDLEILYNSSLTTLMGLENLNSVGGLWIKGNALNSLIGLQNLTSITNDTRIYENFSLNSLSGLDNLNTIGGHVRIYENLNLSSLTGLESVTSIGGDLNIDDAPFLTNLEGLGNFSVGGNVTISFNNNLKNISGLQNLTSIGGELFITENRNLTYLTGLNSLPSVGHLRISDNPQLGICSVSGICDYIQNGGSATIEDNAPGCNNTPEISANCSSDTDCPANNITFITQVQIDDFVLLYPNCTEITGNLEVHADLSNVLVGFYSSIYEVDDLSPFSQITSIGGSLSIFNNPYLYNLGGLDNITSVSGLLQIEDNDNLVSLTGLEDLDYTGIADLRISDNLGLYICESANLCNYLQNGGSATISGNAENCASPEAIIDACTVQAPTCLLSGITFTSQQQIDSFPLYFPECTEIAGDLEIAFGGYGYPVSDIHDLNPLSQITSVENLSIIENPDLMTLNGLNNLTSVGHVNIEKNSSLTDITGLEGFTSIGGDLILDDNQSLAYLTGLHNVTSIGGHLGISGDIDNAGDALEDLSGLSSLVSVGGSLGIDGTTQLTDLTGLENLMSVGGIVAITDSYIASLEGIENIDYSTITGLWINDNRVLSICSVQSVCDYLANGGTAGISNNGYIGGVSDCNSQAEIEAACMPVVVCPTTFIPFSQEDIDNFPSDYPNCTEIQYLDISIGVNITNLDSLAQLTSITGDIEIANTQLTSLWGLHNLTNLGDFLYIYENPNLSICSLPNICDYIESGQETGIFNNAPGCSSEEEIQLLCDSPCTGTGGTTTDSLTHIFDEDLFIDGVGFANNPTVTFTDPGTPANAVLSDITLELYFRLNGNTCENEIAIQITDPAGNTQALTTYPNCDGGTGLYYINLDVPSGNTTGSVADWVVEFNDTNDQNTDYEYSVRFARLNYVATTGGGEPIVNQVIEIADMDLCIDGVGFANNPNVTFPDPATPADAVLSDISLELYFRLKGVSCEEDIAMQITDPAGNTQALTAYTTCDGGNGLYYVNLDIPSGNTTGNVADWLLEFDDTNDQNIGDEYSLRFARLTYTTTTPGGGTPVIITDEVVRTADSDLFIDGVGFDNNPTYTFYDPATPANAELSDIQLELYFRLNGASCENEIAIQLTDPAGNTQPLTTYPTCDGGTGLYYINLDVPSGSTTGSIAPWIVQFDDTNDQNSDYEYSVRFGRLTYTTEYDLCDTQMMIAEENEASQQLNNSSTQKLVNSSTRQLINSLKLYPVPASQHLNVEYFSENNNSTNIEIISNEGKTLMSKTEVLQEGINTIQLDINELPAGHYHIRMYNADDMQMQSFVKIMP